MFINPKRVHYVKGKDPFQRNAKGSLSVSFRVINLDEKHNPNVVAVFYKNSGLDYLETVFQLLCT